MSKFQNNSTSSFSLKHLKKIDQNTKDLIVGYNKELLLINRKSDQLFQNIPYLINYICILFYSENDERIQHIHQYPKYKTSSEHEIYGEQLINVDKVNFVTWKFKINHISNHIAFGIEIEDNAYSQHFGMMFYHHNLQSYNDKLNVVELFDKYGDGDFKKYAKNSKISTYDEKYMLKNYDEIKLKLIIHEEYNTLSISKNDIEIPIKYKNLKLDNNSKIQLYIKIYDAHTKINIIDFHTNSF